MAVHAAIDTRHRTGHGCNPARWSRAHCRRRGACGAGGAEGGAPGEVDWVGLVIRGLLQASRRGL